MYAFASNARFNRQRMRRMMSNAALTSDDSVRLGLVCKWEATSLPPTSSSPTTATVVPKPNNFAGSNAEMLRVDRRKLSSLSRPLTSSKVRHGWDSQDVRGDLTNVFLRFGG